MKKILFLLFLLFLSSCTPPFDYIDSDDFGYPKLTINSTGSNVFSNSSTNLPQCSYWTNSNMSLNGDRLFIMVKGTTSWSPWLADSYCQYNPSSSACQNLNNVIPIMQNANPCGFSCVNPSDSNCSANNYNYNKSDGATAKTNIYNSNNAQQHITDAMTDTTNQTIASNLQSAFNIIATNQTGNIVSDYYGTTTPTATNIALTTDSYPVTSTSTTSSNGTYTTSSSTSFTTSTSTYVVTSSITYTINFDDIYSDIANTATSIATALTSISNAIFATSAANSNSSGTSTYVFIPNYSTINASLGNAIIAFGESTGSYYDIDTCPDYAYDANGIQVGCKVYNSKVMYDPAKICLLTRGDGLYGMVTPPDADISGNSNIACNNLPVNTSSGAGSSGYYGFHLGGNPIFYDTTNTNCLSATELNSSTNCLTSGYNSILPDSNLINTNQGDLYFKIVDNYYPDNSGSYTIMLKSGVGYSNSGPIGKFVSGILSFFSNISYSIYNKLIVEIAGPVNGALVLYIIFSGITLMFGISKMNQKQLMLHLFKIGFVVQLITSATSWDFFNGYFLSLFTDGVNEICCLIESGGSCSDNTTSLGLFDNFIADFFSYETQMKIWTLPINDLGFGLVEAILIEIGLLFFLIMVGYAAIFYVIGFLGIAFLITLFPIFLPFILFTMTKDFFNNWVKMIITNSMEPIIVIAFLALSAQTITNQFHMLLGFPIAYQTIPGISSVIPIKTWVAKTPPHFNTKTDPTGYVNMLVPDNIIDSQGNPMHNSAGTLCVPYACSCYRVPTLPYLQPSGEVLSLIGKNGTPCDNLGYDDQAFIDQIINTGKYTNAPGSFSFLIMTGILMIFIKSVPSIARSLVKGSAITSFDLSNAPSAMKDGLQSIAYDLGESANRVLYNRSATYKGANESFHKLEDSLHKTKEQAQDFIGGKIDFAKKLSIGDASTQDYKNIANSINKFSELKNTNNQKNPLASPAEKAPNSNSEPKVGESKPGETDQSKGKSSSAQIPTNLDKTSNKANNLFSSESIPNSENDKPIIHDVVSRLDQVVNFVGSKVGLGHIGLNEKFEKLAGQNIGETLDAALNVYNTYKDHALYEATGGLLGSDMNKPADARYGNSSRLEVASANFSNALGAKAEEKEAWESYLKTKGDALIPKGPKAYSARESIAKIATLVEQLSANGKKTLKDEEEVDKKPTPHNVSSHLKKAAILSLFFPPAALPYAALAIYNTARNARDIATKIKDKSLTSQINKELTNLKK